MHKKLLLEALSKYILGLLIIAGLVFIPAGTIKFYNGWLFIAGLFLPILIIGFILMIKNPKLLKARLESKEKQKEQSIVIKLSGLMFISGFVVAGLDYRYNFIDIPLWISYIALIVMLLSYLMWAEVLRENTYLARTIKVEEGQTLIDSGLYGLVRHPMYLATILLFLSIPLVLGSLIAFFIFFIYPVLIVIRIVNEEKLLEEELEGYTLYKKKVKYRLIPFVW